MLAKKVKQNAKLHSLSKSKIPRITTAFIRRTILIHITALLSNLTLTLKSLAPCEVLYNSGYFIMISALHILSKRPKANGGAAVKI